MQARRCHAYVMMLRCSCQVAIRREPFWCLVAQTDATAVERSGRMHRSLVARSEATAAERSGREHRLPFLSEAPPPPPTQPRPHLPAPEWRLASTGALSCIGFGCCGVTGSGSSSSAGSNLARGTEEPKGNIWPHVDRPTSLLRATGTEKQEAEGGGGRPWGHRVPRRRGRGGRLIAGFSGDAPRELDGTWTSMWAPTAVATAIVLAGGRFSYA